jgi:hypothetical protein
MRIGSVSVLALAAFVLAACEGSPTTGSSGSNATLALCGLACPDPVIEGDDATPPPPPSGDPDDDTNTNTGNTSNFTTGDTTIALQSAVIISPDGGSVSRLTLTNNTAPDLDTGRIQINTRTANNGAWPVAKTMEEYLPGSGGIGLGGNYREYRYLNGGGSDEELQVWTWGSSYGTQYREVAGGDDARRQAWSFGGTRTTNMPSSSSPNATYTGRYGATSKTWNWVDGTPGGVLDVNNSWRVEGTSNITANFNTSRLTGALTPATWWARDANQVFVPVLAGAGPGDLNWASYMDDSVMLNGVITGNTVSGAARLDPAEGWVNGTNPMYAGFFGPAGAAQEVTGVYNFLAVLPDPIGPEPPINDDARGFVQQSGVFNACDSVCPLPPP